MKGRNQLLMGFTGSLENVTAIKAADGDTILKGKITDMTNPNSEGQKTQRTRFNLGVIWAKELLNFRNAYYARKNPMRSPYNDFVGDIAALQEMLQTDPRSEEKEFIVGIDATNGPIYQPNTTIDINTQDGTDQNVHITWANQGGIAGGDQTDEAWIVAWMPGYGDVQVRNTGNTRGDGEVNESFETNLTHGYCFAVFFVSQTTGENSTAPFMWTLPDAV